MRVVNCKSLEVAYRIIARKKSIPQSQKFEIQICLKPALVIASALAAARLAEGEPQVVIIDNTLKQMPDSLHTNSQLAHNHPVFVRRSQRRCNRAFAPRTRAPRGTLPVA